VGNGDEAASPPPGPDATDDAGTAGPA
jgi:hypothetical protein